jgi:hypothetical protein
MEELGFEHKSEEWLPFIDSFKVSLKRVLLHNRNKKRSIPVAHAVGMKETYERMSHILNARKYKEHRWQLCDNLKVVKLLLGLQDGFIEHYCFPCL